MSPLYLPICGISMPFQANLYVPSLNFQNKFFLLCARTAHETVGSVQYFSILDVLFSRRVFIHLSLHESAVVIAMPIPEMERKKIFTLCCQIINSLESVGMEGNRGYGPPWKVKVWWKKE